MRCWLFWLPSICSLQLHCGLQLELKKGFDTHLPMKLQPNWGQTDRTHSQRSMHQLDVTLCQVWQVMGRSKKTSWAVRNVFLDLTCKFLKFLLPEWLDKCLVFILLYQKTLLFLPVSPLKYKSFKNLTHTFMAWSKRVSVDLINYENVQQVQNPQPFSFI